MKKKEREIGIKAGSIIYWLVSITISNFLLAATVELSLVAIENFVWIPMLYNTLAFLGYLMLIRNEK